MQKKNLLPSGFLIHRVALALALFSGAVFLAFFSFAATPSSGTLTPASGRLTYTSGPFAQSNPSGAQGSPICNAALPCDHYTLTVTGTDPVTHNIVITTSWPITAEDYDIYLLQGATGEVVIKDSASSSDPEVIVVDATPGTYRVRIIPFAVAGGTTTTTIDLVEKPTVVVPPPPGPGTPRYHNFAAPAGMGNRAGEPTLGAGRSDLSPGGRTMYIAGLETLRVTWNDCSSPASAPAFPAVATAFNPLWEDRSYIFTSLITLDPILHTDVGAGRLSTGRTFVSQLGPKTSFLAYTDNDGGPDADTTNDYIQSQGSGINSGVDHQSIGAGPYKLNSVPPPPPHPLYPNAVYYASQDLAIAQMARSDTGSQTFGPAVPMYNLTQCGGLHGHIKVAPDGTVYLPNKGCGGAQGVVVSEDNGLTFSIRTVPGSTPGDTDPSLGMDASGKIYLAFSDGDGRAKVAVSADRGLTWMIPPGLSTRFTDVGAPVGIKNSVFPGAVGGSADRASVQFLATETGGNYQAIGVFKGVWHIYAAHTFDGGQTWTTVRVSPANDPVQRGSICTGGTTCGADRNLLDFNDIEIDHQGRIIIAYADGCVGCTSLTGADSRAAKATIARQSGGKRMLAGIGPEDGAGVSTEPDAAAAPRVNSVARQAPALVRLSWSEPDNGGASLTGYNVYRKVGAGGTYGAPLATLAANKTTYDDTTATDTALQYFYKVTALNSEGESTNCGDFLVGVAVVPQTPCILPGIGILEDQAGDIITPIGQTTNPGWDLRSLSIAEPFGFAPDKLVFTLKVESFAGGVPPENTRWPIQFRIPGDAATLGRWVDMSTFPTDLVGSPPGTLAVFKYGTYTINAMTGVYGAPNTRVGNADPLSSFSADGTIRIIVPRSAVGNPAVGADLTGFLIRVRFGTDAASVTPDNMLDSLAPSGSYTVVGNASCALNAIPIAALSATPLSGDAPLTVNFDASGSSDADPGQTATLTYTFNFGDGSAEVTQASPLISYTYKDHGNYQATVRVTDSKGAVSTNPAGVVIQVGLPLDNIVSRKVHGPAGATMPFFDIDLPTEGTSGVEPRRTGNGDFTIIYTFDRTITATGTATSNDSDATETVVAGPAANQVTVNLTGVDNQQNLEVVLNNVQDSAGANLTGVTARMGVLYGDVNVNRTVTNADVASTKDQVSGSIGESNFRNDVNANGILSNGDVGEVKRQVGARLP